MKHGDVVTGMYGGAEQFTGRIAMSDATHIYIKLHAPLRRLDGSVRYSEGETICIRRDDPREQLTRV